MGYKYRKGETPDHVDSSASTDTAKAVLKQPNIQQQGQIKDSIKADFDQAMQRRQKLKDTYAKADSAEKARIKKVLLRNVKPK